MFFNIPSADSTRKPLAKIVMKTNGKINGSQHLLLNRFVSSEKKMSKDIANDNLLLYLLTLLRALKRVFNP